MNKYGIVSVASITKRFIEGVRLAGDEIVCIASRDINKAKQFAIDNNISKYYGSYEEVYEDSEINIVYIPVINNLHYSCAKQALLHHKNVVLEKPFVLQESQAIELFEIAKQNNCFLFEAVKNVFVPSTDFVKKHLPLIGDVQTVETLQGIKKPFPEEHWMNDISKGGGAYIGSASYVYHYLSYLFNDDITNIDGTYIPSSKSDLVCDFTFNIKDIKCHSIIDMSKDLDNTCTIVGSKGKIIIDTFWRSHHVEVLLKDGNKYEFNDDGNEFVYEAKHIKDCLEKGLLESKVVRQKASVNEVRYINYLYKKWNLI